MFNRTNNARPEILRAFVDWERELSIDKCRVACLLGGVFMPGGFSLDYFVYHDSLWPFFWLRLLSSALLLGLWWLFTTRWGRAHYKALGMVEVSIPLLFISGMIAVTEGAISPYYAGLNLVLMGAGIVLRWTLVESVWLLVIALGMYLSACFIHAHYFLHGPIKNTDIFFNNIYFLVVTGVFAMAGNYIYSRTRFREFELRYTVNEQKGQLEENHKKLVELDQAKNQFFAKISH